MRIDLLSMKLSNPFILGSGPLSYGAQGIIRASEIGIGAVVTKTIRDERAQNPTPHILTNGSGTLINAEKWTDLSPREWVEEELPRAVDSGAKVIASLGHTKEEVIEWAPAIESTGVLALELVSYKEETALEMVEGASRVTSLPIILKVNMGWPQVESTALKAISLGAQAITVMDSLGPALLVDSKTGRPLLGSHQGMGWMTGVTLRPLAQALVAKLALKTEVPIIGLGGVMKARDGLEMLMVGATAIGVCSILLLKGLEYVRTLIKDLEALLREGGYGSISQVQGKSLPYLTQEEVLTPLGEEFLSDRCRGCFRCVEVCPYQARSLVMGRMELDKNRCRYCDLCFSICPAQALLRRG